MTEADFKTFEAVGALVVVLDLDGRIVYWNGPCSELSGYSLEEVRGRPFWDFLLVPEEVEGVKAALAKLPTAEHPTRFANHWVTKAGERRWVVWSNAVTRGPDGRVQHVIKTGIDRTERKQAEDGLAGVMDIVDDAIISFDHEQRIVLYNRGAEEIFGWTAAEVLGTPVAALLPAARRDLRGGEAIGFGGELVARQMGNQKTTEMSGLRKNGEEFPAQAAISRLALGGSSLYSVFLRDVTGQRKREKSRELLAEMGLGAALAARLDYDETLTSIAQLVVAAQLADCCIVGVIEKHENRQTIEVTHRDPARTQLCQDLRRMLLARESRYLAPSVLESKPPYLVPEVSSQYLESLARSDEDLRALRELAPRSLIAVPLLAGGETLGVLTLVCSHPSRRYGPEDLRLGEELGYRAALALENAALYANVRRANRDLREANQQMVSATIGAQESTEKAEAARTRAERSEIELREVGEFREMFIGILGHDLRNPLGSISLSAVTMQQRGHLDERDSKAVGRILSGAQRMSRMISQLLDLTRARLGGGFPLEREMVDLGEICRGVVEEFGASIQLEAGADVTGNWDADRLAEAVSNITGNALEHAARGSTVVVKTYADGADVVVEISNCGDAIPPDVLPFIFEPFRRAKQLEKSATGNLGLGLYIAKQIVFSHGGTLDAHSAHGTTTFEIRLPRAYVADRSEKTTAPRIHN
jgi:PAS domain S-box-containing protein